MTNIYYINIEEAISSESFNKMLGICAKEKREAIDRFRFENDRKRTVYGEVLARYMMAKKTGMKMKDIQVGKNQYGKPYLKDRNEIYFNISHSGKYVVCGLDIGEIGIDIEEVKEIDIDIAKRFFHLKEYDYIVSQRVEQQIDSLYDFWTLKESYIKYLGVGLSKEMDSFYFVLNGQSIELCSTDRIPAYFQRYQIEDSYKLAVCICKPDLIHLEQISLYDIISHIDVADR